MENPHAWNAEVAITNFAGTLDSTGIQVDSGAALPRGWWVVEADCEYYLGTSRTAAVPLASLTTGAPRHLGGRKRRFHSTGDLRISLKAVSASGTYTVNHYEGG